MNNFDWQIRFIHSENEWNYMDHIDASGKQISTVS